MSLNPLRFFIELTAFTQLKMNAWTYELPNNIGMTSLRYVELYANALTTLPGSLNQLTGLTGLNVGRNPIHSIPNDLSTLTIDQREWERVHQIIFQ